TAAWTAAASATGNLPTSSPLTGLVETSVPDSTTDAPGGRVPDRSVTGPAVVGVSTMTAVYSANLPAGNPRQRAVVPGRARTRSAGGARSCGPSSRGSPSGSPGA